LFPDRSADEVPVVSLNPYAATGDAAPLPAGLNIVQTKFREKSAKNSAPLYAAG